MKEYLLKNIKKISFSFPSLLILFTILINISLTSFPLTNIIDYEFSAINSIILFLFSGLFVINEHYKNGLQRSNQLLKNITEVILVFSLIPLLIGVISTLLFSSCPLNENIFFYFIITLPAIYAGISTARIISVIFKKYKYVIYLLTFIVILSIPLFEFYFNPQLYFFNPIFGFYSGTIYDEDININYLVILYRLINVIFFTILICISDYLIEKSRLVKFSFLILIIIAVIGFIFLKPLFHFSTTKSTLKISLGKKLQTEYAEIYYSHKIIDDDEVKLMRYLHDYYYEVVRNQLNIKKREKVTSFVFYNEDEKRRLFGSGRADVTKPWLNHIYLNYQTYKQTLKHEIAHVLASEFGSTIFKINKNLNPAITEGLAMAIENNYDDYPVHYFAKLAYEHGYKINLTELFTGLNFLLNYSSLSYVYAGSFIKYLIDTYGINKVKSFYNNSDFHLSFKKSIAELEKEYYEFLLSIVVNKNKYKAQLYFGSKPIFKKHCPRIAARKIKYAWKLFNDGKFYSAEKLFNKIYNYTENYESLAGLINSVVKLNQYEKAEKILSKEIIKFKDDAHFFNLEIILADIYLINGKYLHSMTLLDSLLIQNPHIEYINSVMLRKAILKRNKNEISNFLKMDKSGKLNYLIKLNEKEIYYFTIPFILKLCNDNKLLEKIISEFQSRIKVNDYISAHATFKLSQAALITNNYQIAKELAIKSLNYKDDIYFNEILVEHLKLVNWLLNNMQNEQTQDNYGNN